MIAAAAAFALGLLICRSVLRRSSADARHTALATAFAAAFLAPVAVPLLGRFAPLPALGPVTYYLAVTPGETAPPSSGGTAPAPARVDWRRLALWAWSIGAAFACARLYTAVRYRVVRSRPAAVCIVQRGSAIARDLRIARRVRFRESAAAVVPETYGCLRPVVVLPSEAAHWSAARLEIVLRHELTHVARMDWAATALAEVCTALHWFNPLAHLALGELRREREVACDDAVIRQGLDRCEYAGHLLGIAAGLHGGVYAPSVAMAQASHLETRIRSILDPERNRKGVTMSSRMGAAAVATAFLIAFSAVQSPAQSGTAGLTGTVVDASSARVPNASVVVRNMETRKLEIVRTNDTGEFSFANLPAGVYTLEVMKAGFQLWRQENMSLSAASAQNVSVLLNLGRVQETLNVVGTSTSAVPAAAAADPVRRIKVGGGVQAAKVVKLVRPAYPQHLKEAGIEGAVLLEGVIGRDGATINLQPLNTQVHPDFVQVATEAVSQWRWEPTYLNGEPVEIVTQINVNFTLAK